MWIKTRLNKLINTDHVYRIWYSSYDDATFYSYTDHDFQELSSGNSLTTIIKALQKGEKYVEV